MIKDLLYPDTFSLLVFVHLFHFYKQRRTKIKVFAGTHVIGFEYVSIASFPPNFHPENHVYVHISPHIIRLSLLLSSCFVHSNYQIFVGSSDYGTTALAAQSTNKVRNDIILNRTQLLSTKSSLKSFSFSTFVYYFVVIISRVAKYR